METRIPVCDGVRPFTFGECLVTRPGIIIRRYETLFL